MNNLIQVERGCMICSINIWLRAVAVHFSTPLRLYQPYACATDTDGEGQKNGQKLTHQSGEEPQKEAYFQWGGEISGLDVPDHSG